MVGTAWFFKHSLRKSVEQIHCLGGNIIALQDEELTWVRTGLDMMPDWNFKQLESAEAIEQISTSETVKITHTFIWAWINENKGIIRARTFAADWGIPESQGNGSGAMLLASKLNRRLEIKHGDGLVIYASMFSRDQADIGDRVIQGSIK